MVRLGVVLTLFLSCVKLSSSDQTLNISSDFGSADSFTHVEHEKIGNVVHCVLPKFPKNGNWTILNGNGKPGGTIPINSIIMFQCNEGYTIDKSAFLSCDQEWKLGAIPKCLKKCPQVTTTESTKYKCQDQDGYKINCSEATDGSSLSYECLFQYVVPRGYRKLIFCTDGNWNDKIPFCQSDAVLASSYPEIASDCGRIPAEESKLIAGGTASIQFQSPWSAAIYKFDELHRYYRHICGGTILSQRVIITAAHCITNGYGMMMSEEMYKVAVGKTYRFYQDERDKDVQYLSLSLFIVNKHYRGEVRNNFADLALIVTREMIHYSVTVQPICYIDISEFHLEAGLEGMVSGWGYTENGTQSDEQRNLIIPYREQEECIAELPSSWADRYILVDKLCAGHYMKRMAVCKGDSGGGYIFKNPSNGRYYIHGIVSIAPLEKKNCNIQQNALFTEIKYHYNFVNHETSRYFNDVCVLPLYPRHGKWVVVEGGSMKPRYLANSSTILRYECDEGFRLLPEETNIRCDSLFFPQCEVIVDSRNSEPAYLNEERVLLLFPNETHTGVSWMPKKNSSQYLLSLDPPDTRDSSQYIDGAYIMGPISAEFHGLISGKPYNISVRSLSKWEEFHPTTIQYHPRPLGPATIEIDDDLISTESFVTRWSEPPEKTVFDGYHVQLLHPTSSRKSPTEVSIRKNGTRSWKFDELIPGESYLMKISTVSGNLSSWPVEAKVTLKPLPVMFLGMSREDNRMIWINWESNPVSIQDRYFVCFKHERDLNQTCSFEVSQELLITDLAPCSNNTVVVTVLSGTMRSENRTLHFIGQPIPPTKGNIFVEDDGMSVEWRSTYEQFEIKWKSNVQEEEENRTIRKHSALISNIFPGTSYTFEIKAICHKTRSEPLRLQYVVNHGAMAFACSVVYTLQHYSLPCPKPPEELTIMQIDERAIKLDWKAPKESLATGYYLKLKAETSYIWKEFHYVQPRSLINELIPGDEYIFELQTEVFDTRSDASLLARLRLAPLPVNVLNVCSRSTNTVKVCWLSNDDSIQDRFSILLEYSHEDYDEALLMETRANFVVLDELHQGRLHNVTVTAWSANKKSVGRSLTFIA